MGAKLWDQGLNESGQRVLVFYCPGCGYSHPFHVGPGSHPEWTWNGSMEKPTFAPSLLVNGHWPEKRCHSLVRDGRIEFQPDCFHDLRGQTVDLPDWDERL